MKSSEIEKCGDCPCLRSFGWLLHSLVLWVVLLSPPIPFVTVRQEPVLWSLSSSWLSDRTPPVVMLRPHNAGAHEIESRADALPVSWLANVSHFGQR